MKSTTHSLKNLGLLAIALTLALAANVAYGQWSNPPASPPNNNVAAPINVSNMAQTKYATITAPFLRAADPTRGMMSDAYCDYDGNNCWDPGTGTGPGGGGWDFVSAPIAHPGSGNTFTVSHGMGSMPGEIEIELVNIVAQAGYSPGDRVYGIGSGSTWDDRWKGAGLSTYTNNASDINVRISPRGVFIMDLTVASNCTAQGCATSRITPANWAFVVKASSGNGSGSGTGSSLPTPPVCTGNDALQWSGSSWSCQTIATGSGGGGGIVAKIRSIPSNILPPAPAGLSEWPDAITCDWNGGGLSHYTMPLNRVAADGSVLYTPGGSDTGNLFFFSDGTYRSRSGVQITCGPLSATSDLPDICAAGYCTFN